MSFLKTLYQILTHKERNEFSENVVTFNIVVKILKIIVPTRTKFNVSLSYRNSCQNLRVKGLEVHDMKRKYIK
jgi:hypothetical protein